MQQVLIDKFMVPAQAKEEFLNRLTMNLDLLKTLPGLIETTAYEQIGGESNYNYVTTAVWESEEALANAKSKVKTHYQKIGFDPADMFKRLNINIDRAIYQKIIDVPDIQEKNKETVRRLYEECLNHRNYNLLNEFISEEYEGSGGRQGPSGFADGIESVMHAFSDYQWTVEDLMADGDKVMVRWSWQGIHTESFRQSLPPTQKQVTNRAIAIYQFKEGKIIKAWVRPNRLGLLRQLGMKIPEELGIS